MAIDRKYHYKHKNTLRDVRTIGEKIRDGLLAPSTQSLFFFLAAGSMLFLEVVAAFADVLLFFGLLYFLWLRSRGHELPSKLPMSARLKKLKDKNNDGPGKNKKPEGILFVGNGQDTQEEIWFTNSDIKTHILYLGTTGAGKTEGLKSLVSNSLCWGSGFVYVDGKADTSLWSGLSSLARRFGRDDDLLVLNYMTGNSDAGAPSNTLNPFSGGSASYLVNLLVTLMPDSGGENAMWKERAVSLIGSLMPALTWRREHQEIPLNINTIRRALNFSDVIKISRDPDIPVRTKAGIKGYLDTLPGYVDDAFDDDGNEKPMPPDAPMVDTSVVRQQHGYLSMQFTRSLQSLADDYGYIFETEAADIDMMDVVLQRRILVVLIPALEKSSDEAANLGKIVAATIKGMMGATLGADVEGDAASTIENKISESATPFMAVFDEVGYYAANGMAVMAAQARSLGFCLIYAAQDLPALEKRVKEEARSITANCNIKIFGKLEDPTQTKEFFEKTVGDVLVAEVSGFQTDTGSLTNSYSGKTDASMQSRARASYDGLRGFKEGDAVVTFGSMLEEVKIFYSDPGNAKSMRIQKMLEPPSVDEARLRQKNAINNFLDNYRTKGWSAATAIKADIQTEDEIQALVDGFKLGRDNKYDPKESGITAIAALGETFMENYQDQIPVRSEPQVNTPLPGSNDDDDDDDDDQGMSWTDLMNDVKASKPAQGTDTVMASVSDDNDDDDDDGDDDFGWGDVMGGDDDEAEPATPVVMTETSVKPQTTPPQTSPQTSSQAQAPVSDSRGNDDDDGGFGWGDIMGGESDNSQNGDVAVSADDMDDILNESGFGEQQVTHEPVQQETAIPPQKDENYNLDAAIEKARNTGDVSLPEGLSPEIEDILKSTAKTMTSGLFGGDNPLDDDEEDENRDDTKSAE